MSPALTRVEIIKGLIGEAERRLAHVEIERNKLTQFIDLQKKALALRALP